MLVWRSVCRWLGWIFRDLDEIQYIMKDLQVDDTSLCSRDPTEVVKYLR